MDHPSISVSAYVKPHATHQRVHAPPHPRRPALFLQPGGHARGRHVRRRHHQVGLARGRRAHRLVPDRRLPHVLRARGGQARLARLARGAGGRVQPAVRPARSRAADAGLPQDGQALHDAGDAGRDLRSVPGDLFRPRAQGRRRQHQEQAHDRDRRHAARRAGRRCAAISSATSSPRASRSRR